MDKVALIVLGALIGALATGGVSAWDAWRQRRVARRVAARVILGDLYVVQAACDLVLKHRRWPDRQPPFEAALETWRESREAFAAGVKAWEWALVDGCLSNLHRTVPMIRIGQTTTPQDESVVADLSRASAEAQSVVTDHVATKRQRDETIKQLAKRAHQVASH